MGRVCALATLTPPWGNAQLAAMCGIGWPCAGCRACRLWVEAYVALCPQPHVHALAAQLRGPSAPVVMLRSPGTRAGVHATPVSCKDPSSTSEEWHGCAGFSARPRMETAVAVLTTSPDAASPGLGYSLRSEGGNQEGCAPCTCWLARLQLREG